MSADNEEQYISEELLSLEPTDEDISLYCQDLGIDRKKDPDLVWIAVEGFRAPLPPHWKYYRAKNDPDVTFFFNSKTGESINEHPLDHVFHEIYVEEKRKKDAGLPYAHCKEELEHPIDYGQGSHHKKRRKKHAKKDSPETKKPDPEPEPEPDLDPEDIFEINSDSESEPELEPRKSRAQTPVRNETFKSDLPGDDQRKTEKTKKKKDEDEKREREIERIQEEHERKMDDIMAMHRAEIDRIERDFEAKRAEKQNQLQNLENQKAAAAKNHEAEMEKLREKNREEMEKMKSDFEVEMKRVAEVNKKRLEEVAEAGEKEIEAEKKAHEMKLAELREANKNELSEIKKAHREKVEAMRKKHEEKLKEIRARASEHLSNEKKKSAALQMMGGYVMPTPKRNVVDVEAASKFETLSRAELERKKMEYEEELANLMARQVSAVAEKKQEGEMQLLEQQRYNMRAIEAARNECEMEIRRYREKVEREKRTIMKSVRQEAMKNQVIDRRLIIQRIASIRPSSSKSRVTLHRSTAKCVNVYDDVFDNCTLTRPQMVFQKKPMKKKKRTVETSPRRAESPRRPEIQEAPKTTPVPAPATPAPAPQPKPKATDDVLLERTEDEEQKMKYSMNKTQREFDANCDKLKTRMNGVFGDMNDDCRELRSFIQEQNKLLSRQAMDFRQHAMEISRNFHQSLNELEGVHRAAISTMATVNADPQPQPQPVYFAPQPPYPVVGFMAPGRSSVRRSRV